MLNNKKFVEIYEYGVKYTKSLKLDVEVNEIYSILDIIEGYFEDILDSMDCAYEPDFYEEELEEEIDTWVEYEEEYEYEYEYEII